MLTAHPPVTIATAQKHLDQHRHGENFTAIPTTIFPIDDPDEGALPLDALEQPTATRPDVEYPTFRPDRMLPRSLTQRCAIQICIGVRHVHSC